MKIAVLFLSALVVFLSAVPAARSDPFNPIRQVSDHLVDLNADPNLLVTCPTWHWGVETNVLRGWKVVPAGCVNYVENYMIGHGPRRYKYDLELVAASVANYLYSLPNPNGTKAVVFDLSETLLSNLPYYRRNNFGGNPFDRTKFLAWVKQGKAPAVPYMPTLVDAIVKAGYKVVVITGLSGELRTVLQNNMKCAGYTGRYSLLLKYNTTVPTKEFKEQKRKQLIESGYTIAANIGDQWRDLTGQNPGERTFKVPNPMYYLG